MNDTAYEARVAERKRNHIPLSKIDDEQIEHNMLFSVFLTQEQQAEVRRSNDYLKKRQLVDQYSKAFAQENDED